jgi:hypothetical protein
VQEPKLLQSPPTRHRIHRGESGHGVSPAADPGGILGTEFR